MSNFHNRSTIDLCDELGDTIAQKKALEERESVLKDEIKKRYDDVPLVGNRWTITVSESVSKRLDTKGLRALLGDALDPYEKPVTSVRVLTKPTMILGHAAE